MYDFVPDPFDDEALAAPVAEIGLAFLAAPSSGFKNILPLAHESESCFGREDLL